jgi:3-deoxy-D-manno-octulosonate 8-phosphate phosphatase (KDO 8-P phosphatase)
MRKKTGKPPLASKVELVLLDVDGVLTRGDIVYAEPDAGAAEGLELKMFNVRDGSAIRWALREGLQVAFMTGRRSRVVERRAADLGVTLVRQGVKEKGAAFAALLKETGFRAEQTAAMGDDLMDLPILARAGFPGCPADAHEEVRKRCRFVSRFPGGGGAVREFLEEIFRAGGIWDKILTRYMEAAK